jgi:hypothetical protein
MEKELKGTMDMIREVAYTSKMKVRRGYADFLADRIIIAGTEGSALKFMERLAGLMDVDIESMHKETITFFIQQASSKNITKTLSFLKTYPKIVAMLATIKTDDEYIETLKTIKLEDIVGFGGKALLPAEYDIPITVTCLSPLSHGSDTKAGNTTLFRRTQILSDTGQILTLPFYAGNALRGQLRDLLADHFLSSLGFIPPRKSDMIRLWLFHALYAGGALDENAVQFKLLQKKIGGSGIIKGVGVYEFRDNIPSLSLLGVALGNRILSGKINVGDLRPCCYEWGQGEMPVTELFEWEFLTRREDNENHLSGENTSMIVNVECLKIGTILQGGIDVSSHITDIERSCLGLGLKLLQENGYIGAENRRGHGQVKIDIENLPDEKLYLDFIEEKKNTIKEYLSLIGGIDASSEPNIIGTPKTKKKITSVAKDRKSVV